MKGVIGIALAFALALCAVPAMAGDTFQAFRTLPAAERAHLTPLADDQLAATEGAHVVDLISLILTALKHNIPIPIPKENISILANQILAYIETQLNTEPTSSTQYSIVYYTQTQVNTDPTSTIQSNVVEVTQRQGNTTSVTTQSR
jgi:hypothetical protein